MSNPFAFFVDKILIGYIAYSPFFRKLARFINNHFQFRNGLAVHTHGFTLYARSPDRILALYLGKYSLLDSFESKLLKTLVSEGMIVIDIGANIGFYTLQLATLVGRKGHVYAFEPDTDNFQLLKKNLAVNSIANATPISKAVSDKTGTTRLYICEEHHGNHTIYDDGTGRNWVAKESITMDDFCGNLIKPSLIKIDIEGAEYRALSGMKKIIKKMRHLMIISEFAPYALAACGSSPSKFLRKMRQYGFSMQLINEKEKRLENIAEKRLLERCQKLKYVNLLFRK